VKGNSAFIAVIFIFCIILNNLIRRRSEILLTRLPRSKIKGGKLR